MEKKIIISLESDNSIRFLVDDDEKFIIQSDKREISAEEIYNILDYKSGDTFALEQIVKGTDKGAFEAFYKLFERIINQIEDKDENSKADDDYTN